MNYTDLFSKGINEFIANAFEPKHPIIYTHIPKCAGTSSVRTLCHAFEHTWNFPYDQIQTDWDRFLTRIGNPELPILELAAGHFWPNEIGKLEESGIAYHEITFLRHPIDRLISQYRYMRSDKHPEQSQFVEKYKSFDDYIGHFVHDDSIAWMLFFGVDSADEYFERLIERFTFVGLSEFYHFGMALLMEANGHRYQVSPKLNVADTSPQFDFEITQSALDRLNETQKLDIEVFDKIYLEYAGIVDQYFGRYIKQHDPVLNVESE